MARVFVYVGKSAAKVYNEEVERLSLTDQSNPYIAQLINLVAEKVGRAAEVLFEVSESEESCDVAQKQGRPVVVFATHVERSQLQQKWSGANIIYLDTCVGGEIEEERIARVLAAVTTSPTSNLPPFVASDIDQTALLRRQTYFRLLVRSTKEVPVINGVWSDAVQRLYKCNNRLRHLQITTREPMRANEQASLDEILQQVSKDGAQMGCTRPELWCQYLRMTSSLHVFPILQKKVAEIIPPDQMRNFECTSGQIKLVFMWENRVRLGLVDADGQPQVSCIILFDDNKVKEFDSPDAQTAIEFFTDVGIAIHLLHVKEVGMIARQACNAFFRFVQQYVATLDAVGTSQKRGRDTFGLFGPAEEGEPLAKKQALRPAQLDK